MQALNQVFIPSINNNEQITCLLMKQMKQTNLNLPFHSEHRHDVHKQRGYICTQFYRCVDRQGQQAVIPQGGGITSGVRGLTKAIDQNYFFAELYVLKDLISYYLIDKYFRDRLVASWIAGERKTNFFFKSFIKS